MEHGEYATRGALLDLFPMGRVPSQRLFTVIGTFAANSEVDGYQMLTNIDDASRLMRYPLGNITGWRLWLDKPLQVDTLSQQTLPPGTQWQDWRAYCCRSPPGR